MKALEDILPIHYVQHQTIVSKMADLTIGFQLQLPEIFTLSAQQLENLHQQWVKTLQLLPVCTIIHKQDWFVQEKYAADYSNSHDFLQQSIQIRAGPHCFLEVRFIII